jgi:hypothetical protein
MIGNFGIIHSDSAQFAQQYVAHFASRRALEQLRTGAHHRSAAA